MYTMQSEKRMTKFHGRCSKTHVSVPYIRKRTKKKKKEERRHQAIQKKTPVKRRGFKKRQQKKYLAIRKVHDGVRDEDGVVNTRHRAVGKEENEVFRVICADAILQQLRCQYLYFCTVVLVKRCSKHSSACRTGGGKKNLISCC